MIASRLAPIALLLLARSAFAQGDYKVEPMKTAPPAELAAAIKGELAAEGVRVLDPDGKPLAEVWIRKAVPATAKPSGAKGTVLFPILEEGTLLGAVRYVDEGNDYRDQSIIPGLYTIRYGLQPVNGDHLGVSPFRDYGLLLPASKDADPAALAKKKLEGTSAEAAGSSHPAVLMLLAAPSGAKAETKIVHDEEKNTWGVVIPVALTVAGAPAGEPLLVQFVMVGMAP